MAKIPCPGCNKNISENAEACPKCGEPLTPEKVEAAKKKQKKFKTGCLSVFLILFVLGSIGKSCSPDNQETASTAAVQTKQVSRPLLGINCAEFERDFESNAAGLHLRMGAPKNEAGFDITQVGCCAYLTVMKTNDYPSKVKEASLMMAGDGSKDSGIQMIGAMGCLIMTASPEISPDGRAILLKEIGFTGASLPEKGEAIRGNKRYWFQKLEGIGLQFGVSAIS